MAASFVEISPEQLDRVHGLYQQGLFLQAYQAAQELGPLPAWQGPAAMVLAGRLAGQLGGGVLGAWLIRRAGHLAPDHDEVRYYYACQMVRKRGHYATWRWMLLTGEPAEQAPATVRSQWIALAGQLAAVLRDFDTAEKWLARALEITPDCPWLAVCRAMLLEQEDLYDEALGAAQRAMELRPWYCPAVESAAHLLTLLHRDEEAVRLLGEASEHLESPAVLGQLYALQIELQDYRAAGDALERCAALAPLADRSFRRWLAAQRSEVAYHLDDLPRAIEQAKLVGREFFKTVAARMEDPARAGAPVVLLPVGFVRQHHLTCVPATLSAISRFWSKPADHLHVAEEICYNGTTSYNERKWAERNDWVAREFTVTETSAAALLDRGVPFTFTTVDPGNSHLQAVIGYDGRRGTLLIRDPFWRNAGEAIADKVLEQYRAYGPRGMALVPAGERARLEGFDLPDAPLWDHLHALDGALVRHCRDEAETICGRLEAEADGHRLGAEARRRLACYDANPGTRLAAVERLLETSPDDACLQLERLACLRDLARRDDRLATYARLCEKRDAHPIFLQQYAQELRADPRRYAEAIALLRRAIRRSPGEGGSYYILAHLLWDLRQFDEALELYRFAACLNDKEEDFAGAYFVAAMWFKRTDEVLAFLRERFRRFGTKSSLPARTLADAYMRRDRTTEAIQAVEEAMRLRPDDGQLQLFAADIYVACSAENMPRAVELLEKAKGASPRGEWLRTAARLANRDGRLADARQLWQELLDIQPLATDAHAAVARLVAASEGNEAALKVLAQAVQRFPHHQPLQQLWLQWVRGEPAEVREPALRRALEASPHDAWLRRELAFFLQEERRPDEAWQEAQIAGELEATNPSYYFLIANLQRDEGKIAEAQAALREAVRLSVDYDYAIEALMGLCTTLAERREVLAFVKGELVRQVIFGDGLLAFRQHAHGTLEPEEMLATLREALRERPDLWHAWSAGVRQLLAMDRRDDADGLARQATERFPLVTPLWLDRAAACRAREDWPGEREALETACQIDPDWATAVCTLAESYERQGEFDEARRLLTQAVARRPLDVTNHVLLAEILWRRGERDAALERIRQAVELEPGYQRAWGNLNAWAGELGRREIPLEVARKLTESRGGQSRSWYMLAEALDAPDEIDQRLAAIEKAIELDPRAKDAHDLRAVTLAAARRWDEALQACRPAFWGEHPPVEMRGRAAWVKAQQGNLAEAIAEMRSVVADEPAYYFGWSRLWDWCRDTEDFPGCLAAAEALVRMNPHYEVSLGYLGEARRLTGDKKGARAAFRRAFELEPGYEYAGNALFDLELEDGDLKAAAETMAVLRRHIDTPFVNSRAVQLAARQGDAKAAAKTLREICTTPCDSTWPIAAAVKAMSDAGWQQAAERVLDPLLGDDSALPEVGVQWVKLLTSQKRWDCGKRLRELTARGRLGEEATYAYLDALAEAGQKLRFRRFLRRNRDWLAKSTWTWGAVGYVLARFCWYKRCAAWVADWRGRDDAQAWMLVNVVESLRATGRDAEAAEAGHRALAMPPSHSQVSHRLWLAADEVCSGQVAAARERTANIESKSLYSADKFLWTLLQSVIEMASAEPDKKPAVFRQVRRRLAEAVAGYRDLRREPARRRLYRQCLRLIANYRGGLGAKLWYWMRRVALL